MPEHVVPAFKTSSVINGMRPDQLAGGDVAGDADLGGDDVAGVTTCDDELGGEFEDIIDYNEGDSQPDPEEDEEEFYIGNTVSHTKDDDVFDEIVGALEDIAVSQEFQDLMHDFCDANCDAFADTEENKLEYTGIFTEWTSTIEGYIEEQLKKIISGFSMSDFLSALSERKNVEEELVDDVLELLVSVNDFATFKDLMLTHKREKALEPGGALSVAGTASKIHQDEDTSGEERPDLDLFCVSSSVCAPPSSISKLSA